MLRKWISLLLIPTPVLAVLPSECPEDLLVEMQTPLQLQHRAKTPPRLTTTLLLEKRVGATCTYREKMHFGRKPLNLRARLYGPHEAPRLQLYLDFHAFKPGLKHQTFRYDLALANYGPEYLQAKDRLPAQVYRESMVCSAQDECSVISSNLGHTSGVQARASLQRPSDRSVQVALSNQ